MLVPRMSTTEVKYLQEVLRNLDAGDGAEARRLLELVVKHSQEALGRSAMQKAVSSRNVANSRLPMSVMGELCERESDDFDR